MRMVDGGDGDGRGDGHEIGEDNMAKEKVMRESNAGNAARAASLGDRVVEMLVEADATREESGARVAEAMKGVLEGIRAFLGSTSLEVALVSATCCDRQRYEIVLSGESLASRLSLVRVSIDQDGVVMLGYGTLMSGMGWNRVWGELDDSLADAIPVADIVKIKREWVRWSAPATPREPVTWPVRSVEFMGEVAPGTWKMRIDVAVDGEVREGDVLSVVAGNRWRVESSLGDDVFTCVGPDPDLPPRGALADGDVDVEVVRWWARQMSMLADSFDDRRRRRKCLKAARLMFEVTGGRE